MLDQQSFDQWAGCYDEYLFNETEKFPFEGYYDVLAYVHSLIEFPQDKQILDVGIGTGLLSYLLYKQGSKIWGIDFSEKMIEEALRKIPTGKIYNHNLNDGIPRELKDEKFDFVITSYTFHYFEDFKKLSLIKELKKLLKEDGKLIIADIAFANQADLDACRNKYEDLWDEKEHYIVADQLMAELANEACSWKYHQVSFCGGVLEVLFDKKEGEQDKKERNQDKNEELSLFPREYPVLNKEEAVKLTQ